MRWVAGDEAYGDAGYFRQEVAQQGLWYVLAVSVSTPVWGRKPRLCPPRRDTGGRPRKKVRLVPNAAPPTTVGQSVAGWPDGRWRRLKVAQGEKGPRVHDWAAQRVVESQKGLPGKRVWLVARRSVNEPSEMAYYLSNAPAGTAVATLAHVASARCTIEQCFEQAKGETGLDHYEVRSWHSGHRHITLSMMAHAWLACVRSTMGRHKGVLDDDLAELSVAQVRALLHVALPLPAWSCWRRRKRQQAGQSHYPPTELLAASATARPKSNAQLHLRLQY